MKHDSRFFILLLFSMFCGYCCFLWALPTTTRDGQEEQLKEQFIMRSKRCDFLWSIKRRQRQKQAVSGVEIHWVGETYIQITTYNVSKKTAAAARLMRRLRIWAKMSKCSAMTSGQCQMGIWGIQQAVFI